MMLECWFVGWDKVDVYSYHVDAVDGVCVFVVSFAVLYGPLPLVVSNFLAIFSPNDLSSRFPWYPRTKNAQKNLRII